MSPSRRIAPWPCVMRVRILRGVMRVRNGGRARCPHRAARVIRVRILCANFAWVNGGASREARRPSIAPGARPCRAPCRGQSRGMQNSQRVLLAKPRTAPWRGGAMGTSRPTAKPHERCARCQAAHRAKARRRDGDIAPYRNGTAPRGTTTGHGQRKWQVAHAESFAGGVSVRPL